MKKCLYLISVLGFICIIASCKKDKTTNPIVTVSPDPLYIDGVVGDLIPFKISISSEIALAKVTITIQPDNMVPSTLLDTTITSAGAVFYQYYRLPLAFAGKSIAFTFKATDANGNSGVALKRVFISQSGALVLTETTGHFMYANNSGHTDAFDLELNAPLFSTVADTTTRDLQDDSGMDTVLSKRWKSPAVGKFVAFNGFDYANATDSSVINAYNSGIKLPIIKNISTGDIFITKLGSTSASKYVLIRISDVRDNIGSANDYYEFSIKK